MDNNEVAEPNVRNEIVEPAGELIDEPTVESEFGEEEFEGLLKDNEEIAKNEIIKALQRFFSELYSSQVVDVKFYVEKIYSSSEEQENEILSQLDIGNDQVAFEVRYDIKLNKDAEMKDLLAGNGEYDEETGWIKNVTRVGLLGPSISEDTRYKITSLGTSW